MQKANILKKNAILPATAEPLFVSKKYVVYSSAMGIILLALSLVANFAANVFATNRMGNPVSDIILDNIPTYNVSVLFFQGFGLFLALAAVLLIIRPKRIPFALKSLAVFILIRSAFIILTHMGPPANEMFFDPGTISKKLTAGADLFFSSHTGLPFLAALVFWEEKIYRYLFLTLSLVFGAAVLLGHLHYSIDVFSAFFITYGIYHISRTLFKKDMKLFEKA
ncbi:MAG: phosphatase PAP2-related protein [Candidatus Moranbacteria bacterium]|nr:phosphatase PAP2-related protein [Candidatus Moranbacteria bacterium]